MATLTQRYAPTSLKEMIGQEHLVAKGGIIDALLEAQAFSHTFFFGPPGSGKTTLVQLIAKTLGYPLHCYNATSLKIDTVRKQLQYAQQSLSPSIVFIDEIHRLTRTQQEVLLPFLEMKHIIIMGASTQNLYHTLSPAISSRSHIFELYPLTHNVLKPFLKTILHQENIKSTPEAFEYLLSSSGGDMRAMLNLLESASKISSSLSLERLQQLRPYALHQVSQESQTHYQYLSALIKSIRGSDIDASLYYLAHLIHTQESLEVIARRLAILASEDIGNANPPALNLASSTLNLVKEIGYPEARIPLAQLVIYLASSPKSNRSYQAISDALKTIASTEKTPPPQHLHPHHPSYLSPHDFGGYVQQSYLQKPYQFYHASEIGFEKTLSQWHQKITQTKNI
jgi:putative ATPase